VDERETYKVNRISPPPIPTRVVHRLQHTRHITCCGRSAHGSCYVPPGQRNIDIHGGRIAEHMRRDECCRAALCCWTDVETRERSLEGSDECVQGRERRARLGAWIGCDVISIDILNERRKKGCHTPGLTPAANRVLISSNVSPLILKSV
jgi:hypothetical protein